MSPEQRRVGRAYRRAVRRYGHPDATGVHVPVLGTAIHELDRVAIRKLCTRLNRALTRRPPLIHNGKKPR